MKCDNWAVSVPEGAEHANLVAQEHGLVNHGEVVPDTKIFHLESLSNGGRAKRSVMDTHENLQKHDKVRKKEAINHQQI